MADSTSKSRSRSRTRSKSRSKSRSRSRTTSRSGSRSRSPPRKSRKTTIRRRLLVLLGLVVCSPLLVPISVLSFPVLLLLAARRRRRRAAAARSRPSIDARRLLDQYLEDQMWLVWRFEPDQISQATAEGD